MNDLRVCRPDGTELLTKRLDPVRSYWIGRDAHCDIVIENPSVSRRHAVMFNTSGHWFISDCGSLEGLDCSLGKTRCLRMTSEAPVIVVSGLPRSGTSMAMQMLKAGGVPVLTDAARGADDELPQPQADLSAGLAAAPPFRRASTSATISRTNASFMGTLMLHPSIVA